MYPKLFCTGLLLFLSNITHATMPLISVTPVFPPPSQVNQNSFAVAVYQVTNNTSSLHSFSMKPIAGVSQVSLTSGSCGNPIELNQGESCLLNLHFSGASLPKILSTGPVVCNNSPKPFACSQPTLNNSLSVQLNETNLNAQNSWIRVLIAQDAPPANALATYVAQIIALAPSLEQIHLRIDAGSTDYNTYTQLINLLRTAYGADLKIGYHPDNSSTSYSAWGCSSNTDWQCVLNASIANMNAMNSAADPKQTGMGFNIFSIEQSYMEPADATTLHNIKACLNPSVATSGAVCPAATIASPVVTFGDVLPSYGGCDPTHLDQCEYGSGALDYGYPQYYNLGKNLSSTYSNLVSNGYFPTYSAEDCINSSPYPYTVVDVDTNGAYPAPKIPCTSNTPNVYTYPDPTTNNPSPTLASAYVAYLMTQLPPISDTPNTNGATVYITFSGESSFLGAPGWTLNLISQFYSDINSNFSVLNTDFPSLFPTGGTAPAAIQYGIWNFTSILDNEN